MLNTPTTQPYKPALQAALRPIDEKAPCRAKLTYLSSRAQNLQIWLSGAVNDILCSLSSLSQPAIHNYQLSINPRALEAVTSGELTGPMSTTTHTISKKPLPCSNCAPTCPTHALLNSCTNDGQKWVEKEKMTIFSLFNLITQHHILLSLSRKSETALTSSARYGRPFRWLSLVLTHLLPAALLQPAEKRNGAEQVTRTVPVASPESEVSL